MPDIWDTYVPTPNWADDMIKVAGGATPSSNEFNVVTEDIYDRLEYLRQGVHPESGIERWLWPSSGLGTGASQWSLSLLETPGELAAWIDQDPQAGVQSVLDFPVILPHGALITGMRAVIWPGDHVGMPTVKPKLELWRWLPGGEGSIEDEVTDNPGSLAAYEALHNIEKTGMLFTTSRTAHYWVIRFKGEANDAVSTFRLCGMRVTFAISNLDPGAG